MPKKGKNSKKLGRPEIIGAEELLQRYKALKQFLESNWGRIGLELQRVRQPEDVRAILKLVPGVEWYSPFRDDAARCLLADGTTKVGWRELGLTRQQQEEAVATERRLFSEYHSVRQKAEEATTALKALISQFGTGISLFPFFLVIALVAKELGVEELTNNSNRLEASLRQAQEERRALHERLSSQEAWYGRNEIVKFARSRRYSGTATNFAKAMAGLPDYGWLQSLRRCSRIKEIKENSLGTAINYQLFELLDAIINKMRPLKVGKVETKLRAELLQEGATWILKAHFGPSWWYIEQAFTACIGKRISRKELPYRLMAAIQDNLERGKTIPEIELAKRRQLV
jgi:hypothetical protein